MRKLHLWIAVALLASASAVVRKLSEIGAMHPVDGRNAISFCNVLFAGNLVGLIVVAIVHRRDWCRETLARVTPSQWTVLSVTSLLSVALAPALTFTALERTSVTSVVLLGRIEPPLVLALAALVLGERLNAWGVVGALVALAGVAASLLLAPSMDGWNLGVGEVCALGGAACLAIGTILTKARLAEVPLGVFVTFRMALGTVVFAIVVAWLFGPEHFIDVLSPVLWGWMFVYGAVIVAAGQLLWFSGLRVSNTLQLTLATSVSPIIAILAAAIILGEKPMRSQWIGGAILLVGIALGARGAILAVKSARDTDGTDVDRGVGFKGT
ncbi:MAG: DMT family transporter [Acidobacteriota bacterium]